MSKSIIIAFSGASYSGKTTTIEKLKSIYQDRLLISDEVIRDKNIDIAELRNDANKYLEFEIDVIQQKIDNDIRLSKQAQIENKILFMDRSIYDSMTYFYLYLTPSKLSNENLIKFSKFDTYLQKIANMYNNILNCIVLFKPLPIELKEIEQDQYRGNDLVYLQSVEYNFIKTLTNAHFNKKILHLDVTKDTLDENFIYSFND